MLVVVSVVMYLAGCGGSSGGSSTTSGSGTAAVGSLGGTVYNTAVSVGDLAQVEFNAQTKQYAYEVIAGFDAGSKDSGTLAKVDGYGNYLYQDGSGNPVVIFPDNIFIAPSEGAGMLVGVPALTTTYSTTAIAGVYNYVELGGSSGTSFSNYQGSYGTFKVNADGTWSSWEEGDLTSNADLGGNAKQNGTWADQGNGVIYAKDGSGNKVANVMIHPDYKGTTDAVLIIDQCDAVNDWYGIMIGVKQTTLSSGQVDGTYNVLASDEAGIITVNVNGSTASNPGNSMNLNYNSPWNGFISSTSDNTIVLITPSGVFFGGGSDTTAEWVFAGMKQ